MWYFRLILGLYLFFINEYSDDKSQSGNQHEAAERNLPAEPVEDEKDEGIRRNLHGRRYQKVDVRISTL